MSKGKIEFKEGKIVAGFDYNEDGENSIYLKLSVGEALQEGMAALKKGEEKEVAIEAKAVKFLFKDGKILVTVDTDKDGEDLLELGVNMAESLEEATGAMIK